MTRPPFVAAALAALCAGLASGCSQSYELLTYDYTAQTVTFTCPNGATVDSMSSQDVALGCLGLSSDAQCPPSGPDANACSALKDTCVPTFFVGCYVPAGSCRGTGTLVWENGAEEEYRNGMVSLLRSNSQSAPCIGFELGRLVRPL
jgi:hypothetical protein